MPAGPLDKWLLKSAVERGPAQQTSHNDIESRDQQTAQPPASLNEGQRVSAGTLEAYFVKVDRPSQDIDAAQFREYRRRRAGSRGLLDWQLAGKMHSAATSLWQHRHASLLRQLCILESHPWQQQVLGGASLPPAQAGSIQAAAFDSQGELLVAGSEEGLLTVHSTAQLMAASRSAPSTAAPTAGQPAATASPLLVLDTQLSRLQAVQWNPTDENVVGVVSSCASRLQLYDLQHTQGQPKQVLSMPQQAASAVGLTDLAFFGGPATGRTAGSSSSTWGGTSSSGYVVLASGAGGQVFMWDGRAKAAPVATLQAAQSGPIHTVLLAPDGQVVVGGSQCGEVRLWDLRGGSSSTLRFGGMVHHHPLLCTLRLQQALTAVPGLASQTTIPASAVHSMQLDPQDPRRLAFHLGCGWSGLVNLHSSSSGGTITHLHAPAHTYPDEASLAADSNSATALQRLLWSATACPGCYVTAAGDALAGLGDGSGLNAQQQEAARVPAAAPVALSHAAICAAAHPRHDLLVAGCTASCLAVAGITQPLPMQW